MPWPRSIQCRSVETGRVRGEVTRRRRGRWRNAVPRAWQSAGRLPPPLMRAGPALKWETPPPPPHARGAGTEMGRATATATRRYADLRRHRPGVGRHHHPPPRGAPSAVSNDSDSARPIAAALAAIFRMMNLPRAGISIAKEKNARSPWPFRRARSCDVAMHPRRNHARRAAAKFETAARRKRHVLQDCRACQHRAA